MSVALAALGIGSALVGGIGSALNANSQNEANAANLRFQREQLDYQKALQQKIFEREDTAIQRRKQDLINAGLNPFMAAGGAGAGAGSVVNTQAPQVQANQNPFSALSGNIQQGIGAYIDGMNAVQQLKQQELYTKYMEMKNQEQSMYNADTFNNLVLDWNVEWKPGFHYYWKPDLKFEGDHNSFGYFKQTPKYQEWQNHIKQLGLQTSLQENQLNWAVADKIESYLLDGLNAFGGGVRAFKDIKSIRNPSLRPFRTSESTTYGKNSRTRTWSYDYY